MYTNESLWLSFVAFDLLFLFYMLFNYGVYGLTSVVIINSILCNLQVLKLVKLFGFTLTLGNILYSSIFLATDLLCELYGRKAANRAVNLGLMALLMFTLVTQFTIAFVPANNDVYHNALAEIFGLTPRIAIASLIAYGISQYHDVWLFYWLKVKTQGRHLWLRKNCSTLISQLVDSCLFTGIAFYGIYEFDLLIELVLTTMLFKTFLCTVETPIIYLAKKVKIFAQI